METPQYLIYHLSSSDASSAQHVHLSEPCALSCEYLNITRDPATNTLSLHLKLRNLDDQEQIHGCASITLNADTEQEQILPEEPLRYSIPAQSSAEVAHMPLSCLEVKDVDLYLWQETPKETSQGPLEETAAKAITPESAEETCLLPVQEVAFRENETSDLPINTSAAIQPTQVTLPEELIPQTAVKPQSSFKISTAHKTTQAPETHKAPTSHETRAKKQLIALATVLGVCLIVVLTVLIVVLFRKQNTASTQVTTAHTSSSSEEKNTQPSKTNVEKTPSLSISCNPSKPFWGVWVYQSDDKSDAEREAASYSAKGYSAVAVETRTIPQAKLDKKWAVTVGTWKDKASTQEVIQALARDGYGNFSSSFSGDIVADTVQSTVRLECARSNGGMLSGKVQRDSDGFVLADSDTHSYTMDELVAKHLNPAELCIAWNEPFARQGYVFTNEGIQRYFEQNCPWYQPRHNQVSLTGIPAANNELFKDFAKAHDGYSPWLYLKV